MSNVTLASIVVAFMLLMATIATAVYVAAERNSLETKQGCIASAYQASRYGHDLEANLAACN